MRFTIILVFISVFFVSCDSSNPKKEAASTTKKLSVIFDTDANNELDDQHALAYLFSNRDYFDIKAVTVNATVDQNMPGLGPKIDTPIVGRHGGSFDNFGDYSVNLFAQIDLHGNPPSRSLFDMAAVAIVKNSAWAKATEIPCPTMTDKVWVEQPDNPRRIIVWEHFDKENILKDFYQTLSRFN